MTCFLPVIRNIEIAQKFTQAVGSGGGPGGCKTLEQCEHYCDDSAHTDECLDYVGKKDLLPIDELNKVRKVAEGFRQGVETPGHCRDITGCNVYCSDPSHLNECATYASKVGYFSGEQAAEAKKFSSLVSQGATPGGCKSKEECEQYCANDVHKEGCADFALSAGFISKEDAEAIKKYGGGGPGGCKSKDECSSFCNQPSNQNSCLQYAKEHNIPVDFKGPGGCSDQASCTAYCQQHIDDPECQKMVGQYGGMKGPGGCSSMESCMSYCKSNPKDAECAKYAGSAGQYGGFSGPGGCTDEASCISYCKSNPKDSACAQYAGQYGGGSSPDQGQQQPQDQPPPQQPTQSVAPQPAP